jgi:hypothetical protein
MKPTQRLEVPRSDRLVEALSRGIASVRPKAVIESGTFMGTGSTRLILEAFAEARPEAFYTIEVAPSLVQQARANLAAFPWVEVVWGLSVNRQQAIAFVESDPFLRDLDPSLDIFVDFLPDPRSGYLDEVRKGIGGDAAQDTPDGMLVPLLEKHRNDRPLISLDSAGGISWLEFQIMRETMGDHPYLLFLDDINHIKHYRSKLAIESSKDFAVYDCDFEEGWMVAGHRVAP